MSALLSQFEIVYLNAYVLQIYRTIHTVSIHVSRAPVYLC